MNSSKLWIYTVIILLAASFSSVSSAQNTALETSRVLAVIPVKSRIDKSVYAQFDRLVPELRKISKDNIVKLECSYSGRTDREQDVLNAYQIAGKIEQYLRLQHKLELDLWITIQLGNIKSKSSSILTIALFADDVKRLDSVPIEPKGPGVNSVTGEKL